MKKLEARGRARTLPKRLDLLDADQPEGVNLSVKHQRALAADLASGRPARWREKNRCAISAYNDYVDEHGAFSDGVRSF